MSIRCSLSVGAFLVGVALSMSITVAYAGDYYQCGDGRYYKYYESSQKYAYWETSYWRTSYMVSTLPTANGGCTELPIQDEDDWRCFMLGDCPVPDTCGNGAMDGDEEGVDCGGSCAPCNAAKCPDGCFYDGYACRPSMPLADAMGNCPPGTVRYGQTNSCYDPAYLISENGGVCPGDTIPDAGVCVPAPLKYNDSNPEPDYPVSGEAPVDSHFAPSANQTSTETSIQTVDNGDGTSTRTTTETSSSSSGEGGSGGSMGGSSSVTITTEIIDNATGDVVGSSTVSEDTDENPLSNPGNYTVGDPNGDADGVGDRFAERSGSFTNTLKTAPIYSAFNNVFSVPSGGTSTYILDMGSYGTVSVDLNNFSTVFAIFGWALVFASLWIAGKLVIANKG